MARSEIVKSAEQSGLGVAGLLRITFAAVRLDLLQPGAVSLLYFDRCCLCLAQSPLFFVSWRFVDRGFLLQYYLVPLFRRRRVEESSYHRRECGVPGGGLGDYRNGSRVRKMTEAQLTLRFDERLSERTQIARELHDTLLQVFRDH
ncbi:MAG TPA: hypothetical protein VKB88_26325 [Bryobacteraceae bacterium]|nr:hypothetical protein [Bryobacteraceae bacterium]